MSHDEIVEAKCFSNAEADALLGFISRQFGVTPCTIRVSALCIGRGTDPEIIREPMIGEIVWGQPFPTWIPQFSLVVGFVQPYQATRLMLIHGLSHALLNVLSGGFEYPRAIQDGFARLAQSLLRPPYLTDEGFRRHIAKVQGVLTATEYLSVWDILHLGEYAPLRRDASERERVCLLALWLVVYLGRLVPEQALIKRMLKDLPRDNLRTPKAVYELVLESLGVPSRVIEWGFLRFCREGVLKPLTVRR